jgi:transcriptional regulator with XRE-family HTH domain
MLQVPELIEETPSEESKTVKIRKKYKLFINDRLKQARKNKGLTLHQTVKILKAKGVKIALASLQGYEANEESINHRYPSVKVLLELVELYECSLDFVFGQTDELGRQSLDLTYPELKGIHKRLKESRIRKGVSIQKAVEELNLLGVDITEWALFSYESGDKDNAYYCPSIRTLLEICNFYNVSIEYLLGRTSEISKQTTELTDFIKTTDHLTWNGVKIPDEHRGLILYKIEQIMNI